MRARIRESQNQEHEALGPEAKQAARRGVEPRTFRLTAGCTNHCATEPPLSEECAGGSSGVRGGARSHGGLEVSGTLATLGRKYQNLKNHIFELFGEINIFVFLNFLF